MTRREALASFSFAIAALAAKRFDGKTSSNSPRLAITIDDPTTNTPALYSSLQKNQMLLDTFERYRLKAALFVCGKRIDSAEGSALIKTWDEAGHLICNHSYSHLYYNAPTLPFEIYRDDMIKGEKLIDHYSNFTKLFRFPYLKEGDTKEKRDTFREYLKAQHYHPGYVTLDTSDWYIDDRLKSRLKADPKADPKAYLEIYRKYYLDHIWERAQFYNALALEVTGRQITHTILLHHTLTNALWLGDMIAMMRSKGWEIVNADEAFRDPVFAARPNIVPAGESIIWALAKETGKYDLRYPGEDDVYEKPAMDKLGL